MDAQPAGLGCMRLSTDAGRDDARAAAVLAAAIDAGIELLDTADAYALDDSDAGHNERLIARVMSAAMSRGLPALPVEREAAPPPGSVAAPRVQVVTKGGLTRPGGAWTPDGRARHLADAARRSRDRLEVAAIDLYLLHAVDPRTPLATSVRALARIRDDGIARAIGLSNVGLTQLEAALAITPIDAVEVELHPWRLDAIRGGLVAACAARGIRVLAHRPLGGPAGCRRAARDPVIAAHAARLGATPAELVLAWLRALSPAIVPLPGATRIDTATSAARAARLALDDEARSALAAHLLVVSGSAAAHARAHPDHPTAARVHADPTAATHSGDHDPAVAARASTDDPAVVALARDPVATPTPDDDRAVLSASSGDPSSTPAGGEIVLIVGMPASGKSTLAADHVARGYTRLNRDERGGSLLDLARALDRELAAGTDRVVVDNTYPSRASRAPIVEVARRHGVPIRCVAMTTPLEDAQANAVARLLARHGRLLEPAELARAGLDALRPGVQFRFRRDYEPPRADEGFASIEEARAPRVTSGSRRALIVELDGLVWRSRPRTPEAIQLLPGAREAISAWLELLADPTAPTPDPRGQPASPGMPELAPAAPGMHALAAAAPVLLAGTTWQPGLDPAALAALAARLVELVGRSLELLACTHPAGPPICWCRKPLPGLALAFARSRDVDLARSIHAGHGPADRGFAVRAGLRYVSPLAGT